MAGVGRRLGCQHLDRCGSALIWGRASQSCQVISEAQVGDLGRRKLVLSTVWISAKTSPLLNLDSLQNSSDTIC